MKTAIVVFLSIVLNAIAINVAAQQGKVDDVVVMNNGKFLRGKVKIKSKNTIEFTQKNDREPVKYTANQIAKITVDGIKSYVSIKLNSNFSTIVFAHLVVENSLVQLVIFDKEYYIKKGDSKWHMLRNSKVEENQGAVSYTREYLTLLRDTLFNDSPKPISVLQQNRLLLSDRPLIAVIKEYSEYRGIKTEEISADKPWVKIGYEPFIGTSVSRFSLLHVSAVNNIVYLDGSVYRTRREVISSRYGFNSNALATIGVRFYFYFPRQFKYFSFVPEFSYQTTAKIYKPAGTLPDENIDWNVHYRSVNLSLQGRQTFYHRKNNNLFASAGVTFSYMQETESHRGLSYSGLVDSDGLADGHFNRSTMGGVAKFGKSIGIGNKKLNLQLDYQIIAIPIKFTELVVVTDGPMVIQYLGMSAGVEF
jgi:hypothetical protein